MTDIPDRARALRRGRILLVAGTLALSFLSAAAAPPEGGDSSESSPLGIFEPFIGRWKPPADSPMLKERPELAETVVFDWEWGPRRSVVRVFHHYPMGRRDETIVEGLIHWDPVRGRIVYTESNTKGGFLFVGEYTPHGEDGMQRTYDVLYRPGEPYIPEPEMPGTVRRFREIFTPDGPDAVDIYLDIFDFGTGAWRPWGRAGGHYRMVRVEEPASPLAALPESALPPVPDEAVERLEHMLGRWDVRAEYFDKDGNPAGTGHWENEAHYLIDGRVALLTHNAPELGVISKALVFYSEDDGLYHLVDVNQKGELWLLSGGLDRFVFTSEPRPTKDGREIVLRFTHENIQEDSAEAVMEYSFDGGATWTKGNRQYLTRRP